MSAQGEAVGLGSNDALVENLIERALKFCHEGDLALERLEEVIGCIPRDAIQNLPLLHYSCLNPAVTLEVVRLLLDLSPGAAGTACVIRRTEGLRCRQMGLPCPGEQYISGARSVAKLEVVTSNADEESEELMYPIHLACYNSHCPNAAIKLLAEKNPSALEHCSTIAEENFPTGLPLRHYLARSSYIDIHVVKTLVESNPDALVTACENEFNLTPLHIFIDNKNMNESTVNVLRYLVDTRPECLRMHCESGGGYCGTYPPAGSPLHIACANENISPSLVEVILDSWEDSAYQRNVDGDLPIHFLCGNEYLGEAASLEILDVLLSSHPDSVQSANNDPGHHPIHVAAFFKSVSFCKRLINAYPESVKLRDAHNGHLPFHLACSAGRLDNVKYLLDLHPDSAKVADGIGDLPIQCAAYGPDRFLANEHLPISKSHHCAAVCSNGLQTAKVIEILLLQESNVTSRATSTGSLFLLHEICGAHKSNLDAAKLLFDAYPDTILAKDYGGMTPLDIAKKRLKFEPSFSAMVFFLEGELVRARQAQNAETMMKRDGNGWLPIHGALQSNASLGAIKLLYRGNPCALTVADNMLALPIHIACVSCRVDTIKFLLDHDDRGLKVADANGDLPLHYACRGVNCGVIKYLAGRYPASVEKRNGRKKLPLHLLCENGCLARNSPEHIEAVWILIRAKPDALSG